MSRAGLVLLAAWAFVVVYAFPGQMSWASYEYLHAARHELFTDAHPPMISAIWWVVECFIAGPLGMLMLQTATFLGGLYLILRRFTNHAAWIASALAVFPPVLVTLGVIWTYTLMASLLVLGTALITSDDKKRKYIGLAIFALAVAVEPVALAATLPLIGLLYGPRFAISLAAWVAVAVVALGANALITTRYIHREDAVVAAHDIAGTLRYSGKTHSDAELQRLLAGTHLHVEQDLQVALRKAYSPRTATPLVLGGHQIFEIPMYGDEPLPDAQVEALSRARRSVISAHPFAYAKHRLNVMKRVLGLVSRREYPTAVLSRDPPDVEIALGVGVPTRSSELQDVFTSITTGLAAHTPLFVPWIYLVMAIAVAIAARRQRLTLAIALSGIAGELVLFVRAYENDYRQSHWLIASACLALVLWLVQRRRA